MDQARHCDAPQLRKTVTTVLRSLEYASLPHAGRYRLSRFGNDLRKVGVTGFEPATFCTPCRRASQVTLHPGLSPKTLAGRAGSYPWRHALVWKRGRNLA